MGFGAGMVLTNIYWNGVFDCGECFNVYPVKAIVVEDDDISQIFSYKHRILLVPAIFFAQFEDNLTLDAIKETLYEMGFTELCTVDQSADLLVDEINKYIQEFEGEKPVISSFCPAVVRLIQVLFPSMKEEWAIVIHGLEDVGIFYVTPCTAKIAAIKAPVGGYNSPINGVINMSELYNKVFLKYKQKGANENEYCNLIHSSLSSAGVRWATTGRSLAIDSMPNVIDFLERFENEENKGVDFLELLRILPDIDCGACRAPSCEALADDIVCNRATLEHCVLMHAHEVDPDMMEKI